MVNPAEAAPPVSEPPASHCLNCAAPLSGPYCAHCGQRDHDLNVSLRNIASEFAEDYFHFDSKLPRSLGLLLASPGRLTREFIQGKRVRYVGPFKLYVLCSVVFFLAVAVLPNVHKPPTQANGPAVKVDFDKIGPGEPFWLQLTAKRFKARYQGETAQQVSRHAVDALTRYMPDAMLVLMPVFALMLKLLYRRRYYAEHFVTSLHLHALGFLVMLAMAVCPVPQVNFLLMIGFLVHSLLALRRIYAQGWVKSVFKFAVLGFAYTFTVCSAVVAVMIGGMLLG